MYWIHLEGWTKICKKWPLTLNERKPGQVFLCYAGFKFCLMHVVIIFIRKKSA